MTIVAIIPARGGSKGVQRKNTRKLLGKPLIAYTIEAAKKAKKLDDFYISTEDTEIKKVAKKYRAKIIDRPIELAMDDTPMYKVLQHAVSLLESNGEKIDVIVLLQPTSPIRNAADIDRAIITFLDTGADSVVSVREATYHPYWTKKIENEKLLPFVETEREYFNRQELPKVYQLNGSIYITKRDVLMNENKILGNFTKPYIMDEFHSIDIDTELDFLTAEAALKKLRAKKKDESY